MKTPKNFRLHIGIFGQRNAGKSSILNLLTHQETSIVSDVAGTTTDPVEKPMELLPLGPVQFIDTAGIDDDTILGEKRVAKTFAAFDRTDLGVVVTSYKIWGKFEKVIISEFFNRNIPYIIIFNKIDLYSKNDNVIEDVKKLKVPFTEISAKNSEGISDLRKLLLKSAPADYIDRPSIIGDLITKDGIAVLVTPIDKEAPKGRLILPQVQTIRDILDNNSSCIVIKENQLRNTFERLKEPPELVITDSQAFQQVAANTPKEIPLTSFSILFARFQGDLTEMVKGAATIGKLKKNDKVLIAESCTHHPITEDIGTVKIPRWLREFVGGNLQIDNIRGNEFPSNISDYQLIIHCGACMRNRRELLSRILRAQQAGVPITNYGLAIAYTVGIFERALQPFPRAKEAYSKITNG